MHDLNRDKQKIMTQFSDTRLAEVRQIIDRYPEGKQKSALIPVLHMAQEDFGGWLSPDTMDYVGSLMQLEPIEVYEVASFYSMFNLSPVGKHLLEVCQTGPCMLNGSESIVEYIYVRLGIRPGETTADGQFTLKTVECLGACGYAPMLQLGEHYKEHLTKEKIDALIESCYAKSAALN